MQCGAADPLKHAPSKMRYLVEFGRSRSNRMGVTRESQKIWGRWSAAALRWRRGWPHRNTLLPRTCYRREFGHSRSNGTGVIKEILLKTLTLASRLSRSLEIIWTDRDRSATYDIQLTLHSRGGATDIKMVRQNRGAESSTEGTRIEAP